MSNFWDEVNIPILPVTNFKTGLWWITNFTNAYCLKVVSDDTKRQLCTIIAECIHSGLSGEYLKTVQCAQ